MPNQLFGGFVFSVRWQTPYDNHGVPTRITVQQQSKEQRKRTWPSHASYAMGQRGTKPADHLDSQSTRSDSFHSEIAPQRIHQVSSARHAVTPFPFLRPIIVRISKNPTGQSVKSKRRGKSPLSSDHEPPQNAVWSAWAILQPSRLSQPELECLAEMTLEIGRAFRLRPAC
jgi:hypothetical protein